MFFVLSKVFYFFAAPAHACLLLAAVGLALLFWTRRTGWAKGLLSIGLAGLVVFGFSPFSSYLMSSLEDRFPPAADVGPGNYAGIILLGGFEDTWITTGRGVLTLTGSAERFVETLRLARRMPSAKVIFTGGSASVLPNSRTAGGQVARYLRELGVRSSRIVIEPRSRNTWENATFTHDMIKPGKRDRYLLVTSARHMPRSIGVFRKAGFNVSAWPTDYRSTGGDDLAWPYDRMVRGLNNTNLAVKELIGLFAYWITGRSSALFPEPAATQPRGPGVKRLPNGTPGS